MSVRSSSVTLGHLSMVAVAVAAVSPVAVLAQTTEAAPERIQVTGSRILREGAIAPSPVTVISGRDLVETGAMNIGEVLNELPSLAATSSLANSGRSIGTSGLSVLDLRGMGSARTLVLVDGRRHVASSAGSAAVDTNTIPTAWIDSVEIITGGASAVYGADAVTGVVNFRLKKNITGFDFSATKGVAEDSPYENQKVSASFGSDFAQGAGNFAFAVEYGSQDGINAKDRRKTSTPYMSVPNPAGGLPTTITLPNAGWYDNLTSGNMQIAGKWYTFNPDGTLRDQNMGTVYGNSLKCSNCDFLDLQEYVELQPNFDRLSLNGRTSYEFTPAHTFFAEAKYVKSKGDRTGQPAYFDGTNSRSQSIMIQRDNPFIDAGLAALMDTNNLSSFRLNRFLDDAGRRYEANTRETSRIVMGLEGELTTDWGYEFYAIHGETKLAQTSYNNLIRSNFAYAVDAIRLDDGSVVCRDETARKFGCMPISLFGENSIDPEAVKWLNTTSYSTSKIKQSVVNFSVNNSALLELPAGMLGFSAGTEFRKEQSEVRPDAFSSTGATFFNALQPMKGSFDVKEAFVEISAPLLADLPFMEELLFDVAVRVADYSTIGDATSWKLGLDWSVNRELRFRATYSEALRAPNISELFGPQNQTFFGNLKDPCALSEKQNQTRIDNCAALGIAADFDLINPGGGVEGLNGGNPDLKAEKSESYTAGFVYQPEFLAGFSVTADYWLIDISNAIQNVSAQNILNRCVDSPNGLNQQFCGLIQRDPATKQLDKIISTTQNVAAQKASGVDVEFGYDFDALGGRFNTKLITTYLHERKSFSFQAFPDEFIENAGSVGDATWQANLMLNYRNGAWSASWKTRFVEAVDLNTPQQLAITPMPNDIMSYGSYFVSNATLGYQFDSGVNLVLGVDNLFDRDLPGVTTGTTASTGLYNNIGRFYYTRVSYSF